MRNDVPDLHFDDIERALRELERGRPVIVVDDEDRENEGDLVMAAGLATPEALALFVRYSSGILCAPMPAEVADRLELPLMTATNQDPKRTAFTVSVDAREGVSTGVSASDRARTLRVLADPSSTAAELTRPGHVFPLRAVPEGVLGRRGHTEAAVDLLALAGLSPVGLIGEITRDTGDMARLPDLLVFAKEHNLALITIADLVEYRRARTPAVRRVASSRLPTLHGEFTVHAYQSDVEDVEHLAMVLGEGRNRDGVMVRLHSECRTGDALGSLRCDCGAQLGAAMARVAAEGAGAVLYLGGHEGRGIGLAAKIQAYALQDNGRDTVQANHDLGYPNDLRDYRAAAGMLLDLGMDRVRLLTNNPAKCAAMAEYGVTVVDQVPLVVGVTEHSLPYLRTKRDVMGHDLGPLDQQEAV